MLAGEENVDGLESRIQVERGAGAGYPGGGHRPNSQVRILNAHSEQGKSEYVNCVLAFLARRCSLLMSATVSRITRQARAILPRLSALPVATGDAQLTSWNAYESVSRHGCFWVSTRDIV